MKRILTLLSVLCMLITLQAGAQKNALDPAKIKQLVVQNAAALGLSQNDLENFRVNYAYYDKTSGTVIAYLQQTWMGVDVYNAISTVTFKNDKVAVSNFHRSPAFSLVSMNKQNVPSVSAIAAVQKAATEIGLTPQALIQAVRRSADGMQQHFGKLGIASNDITAHLMWVPSVDETSYMLGWQVSLNPSDGSAGWLININASTGAAISKTNLLIYERNKIDLSKVQRKVYIYGNDDESSSVNMPSIAPAPAELTDVSAITSAKYNVIPYPYESPLVKDPTLVQDPWTISTDPDAITNKWHTDGLKDYDSTKGNNVYVSDDYKGDDEKTTGWTPKSTTALPNLTFNSPPDFSQEPYGEILNRNFGLNNLFYWNNLMHDLTYHYGFDEPAGNYQQTNFGRGGAGGDQINATDFDNTKELIQVFPPKYDTPVNNANFLPTVDGTSGRMQIYHFLSSVYKTLKINSPASFAGFKPAREGAVSSMNKLSQLGIQTNDVVIYKDLAFPDSSTGCGLAQNAAALAGKFAYIDRGSCSFTVKYKNAQSAGAKGIIVGNVSEDDPRYATEPSETGGNRLLTMSGSDNTILIPGVFIQYDSAQKIKSLTAGGQTVNATMYPSPALDGALDNTIHPHEYTHGISNRLTGGPLTASCLNNGEQMGEGWSDYYALMMTTDWTTATVTGGTKRRPIGNYGFGQDTTFDGIRSFGVKSGNDTLYYSFSYSTDFDIDPITYDSLRTNAFSEADKDIYQTGDFWCTALWEMTWELIKANGISTNFWDPSGTGGNVIAMHLVTQGMKLQKCSPGCVDGRDAILKADTLLYGGSHSREIWTAFARRGLGYSASQGSNALIKDAQGAYDLPTALPVKWGSFTASKQGNAALLKWTTVSESNADKFVVERSTDGRTYTAIGEVKAANSSNGSSYSLTDNKPFNGNNNYRIKQVDKDGKSDYSDIRSLNFADLRPLITLAPNPAKDFVNVKVEGNTDVLTLQLTSNTGQVIGTYTMSGENYTINISSLAHGIYNLSISGKGYTAKYRLVVQ